MRGVFGSHSWSAGCGPLISHRSIDSRGEGESYVERLRGAGVPARLSRYDGVHHRFAEMIGILDQAAKARDEMCAWLREVLAESGPSTAPPGEGMAITQSTSDGLVRREGRERAGEEVGM
jgi:hypothetical protein